MLRQRLVLYRGRVPPTVVGFSHGAVLTLFRSLLAILALTCKLEIPRCSPRDSNGADPSLALSFVLERVRGLLSAQRQAGPEGAHSAPIRFGLSPGPLGSPFGVCGLSGSLLACCGPVRWFLKG